jgi:hypothetical protein
LMTIMWGEAVWFPATPLDDRRASEVSPYIWCKIVARDIVLI